MLIKIALILSVILQFMAAVLAISLVKRTTKAIAWWLISLGFLLMAFRRFFEVLSFFDKDYRYIFDILTSWSGVLISMIMLASLLFIKRIFNIQSQIDHLRKENEARVLSAIIKTEEKERQHFASELHDGLGPLLASVKMSVSAMRQLKNDDNPVMHNAEKLIDESLKTLKEISNKLSPHILNNFGLYRALDSFIQQVQPKNPPFIHFNSDAVNVRFDANAEVMLYRVACELIVNTLQHADAHNIYIDLIVNSHEVRLNYLDDGKGYLTDESPEPSRGQGFFNIQSRIRSLNGFYHSFSSPGEGVHVNILIPLKSNE